MQFEIVHEFDIPLDALELAVLSPQLLDKMTARLTNIEHAEQCEHKLEGDVLARVWAYKPNVRLPAFARPHVKPEMMGWHEHSKYHLKRHEAEWHIVPSGKPEWQKYFSASGTYRLVPQSNGGTKRVVNGTLHLHVPWVGSVAERMIVGEVKKTFEAEAATLRDLATLV